MKFQRHMQVFRGQLDAAPFACVFFLLAIFMLVNSSLVFVPGVRLEGASGGGEAMRARLLRSGRVEHAGREYEESGFVTYLKGLASSNRLPSRLIVFAGPGAGSTNLARLRDAVSELKMKVETPSAAIELPAGAGGSGLANPGLAVAVNVSGQYFFDNRLCSEAQLRERLAAAVRGASSRASLLILADRNVRHEAVLRLVAIAREAGIEEFVEASRPAVAERAAAGER